MKKRRIRLVSLLLAPVIVWVLVTLGTSLYQWSHGADTSLARLECIEALRSATEMIDRKLDADGRLPLETELRLGKDVRYYLSKSGKCAVLVSSGVNGNWDLVDPLRVCDGIEDYCQSGYNYIVQEFDYFKATSLTYDPTNGLKSDGDMYRLLITCETDENEGAFTLGSW